jgi:hypothetical protein
MGVTLVTYVTFVSIIIGMCHWSPNVSYEACYEWISIMSGEEVGVKKCLLGLRQTSLLLAEDKKVNTVHPYQTNNKQVGANTVVLAVISR